jgi:polyisoprenoid-binding protein YceI
MNRGILIGLILLVIGAGLGAGGMWWVLGGSGTPSEPISAPTLSLDTTEEVNTAATEVAQLRSDIDDALGGDQADDSARVAAVGALAQQVDALSTAAADMLGTVMPSSADATTEAEPTEAAATEVPPTATPEAVEASSDEGARSLYRINAELSEVRFIIHEELFGNPKEVIGATNEVAGDIIVDFSNPANSQVGEIRVNARTLETDDENRTRALRNQILQSRMDEFEFATFVPTGITGLPEEPVAVGDTVTFQLTGDLTVRNITSSVTFDVSVTLDSDERLEGSASTSTTRAAYELTIPNAPGVANVTDEVTLEIDFVADLVESA